MSAKPSVFIIRDGPCDFCDQVEKLVRTKIHPVASSLAEADLAVAPRLRRKLRRADWSLPKLGTLIFHPSVLPYRRGPDAIRWAVQSGERVSGVTWFWADDGLDTGPICEQEPVVLAPAWAAERPGDAYRGRYIPAGLRALERALDGIAAGNPRRVAQIEELATYDSFWK